jgi:hypothetical protein
MLGEKKERRPAERFIGAADMIIHFRGWCSFDGRLTDEIHRDRNSSKLKGKKRGCCLSITFAFACPS